MATLALPNPNPGGGKSSKALPVTIIDAEFTVVNEKNGKKTDDTNIVKNQKEFFKNFQETMKKAFEPFKEGTDQIKGGVNELFGGSGAMFTPLRILFDKLKAVFDIIMGLGKIIAVPLKAIFKKKDKDDEKKRKKEKKKDIKDKDKKDAKARGGLLGGIGRLLMPILGWGLLLGALVLGIMALWNYFKKGEFVTGLRNMGYNISIGIAKVMGKDELVEQLQQEQIAMNLSSNKYMDNFDEHLKTTAKTNLESMKRTGASEEEIKAAEERLRKGEYTDEEMLFALKESFDKLARDGIIGPEELEKYRKNMFADERTGVIGDVITKEYDPEGQVLRATEKVVDRINEQQLDSSTEIGRQTVENINKVLEESKIDDVKVEARNIDDNWISPDTFDGYLTLSNPDGSPVTEDQFLNDASFDKYQALRYGTGYQVGEGGNVMIPIYDQTFSVASKDSQLGMFTGVGDLSSPFEKVEGGGFRLKTAEELAENLGTQNMNLSLMSAASSPYGGLGMSSLDDESDESKLKRAQQIIADAETKIDKQIMDKVNLQSYEGAVELTRGPDDTYGDNILELWQEEADALGPQFLTMLKDMQNFNDWYAKNGDAWDWTTLTDEQGEFNSFKDSQREINDTIESIAANTGITIEELYEALGNYASANDINATSVIQTNNNNYTQGEYGNRVSHLNSALFTQTASD